MDTFVPVDKVSNLREAAQKGEIDTLYRLIRLDPNILEHIDEVPFVDTPLHVAAAAGNTHFAIEIMSLKPSSSRKLNPDGFSPLHLALQFGKTETVRRLVEINNELICVQGKGRYTPLHHVAEEGDADLLAKFLLACPRSIEDVTLDRSTALHLAVKKGRIRALKVMLGWLERTNKQHIIHWKDEAGNTLLHIAASANQPEVMEFLLTNRVVDKDDKNLEGLSALDAVPNGDEGAATRSILLRSTALSSWSLQNTTPNMADYLSSPVSYFEKWIGFNIYLEMGMPGNIQNAVLVVAVLIVTAAYQACLSPPGGIFQGGSSNTLIIPTTSKNCTITASPAIASTYSNITDKPCISTSPHELGGKVIMPTVLLNLFVFFNSMALGTSCGLIFLIFQHNLSTVLLLNSLYMLLCGYMLSIWAVMDKPGTASYITFWSCFSFSLLVYIVKLVPSLRVRFLSKNQMAIRLGMQRKVLVSKYTSEKMSGIR